MTAPVAAVTVAELQQMLTRIVDRSPSAAALPVYLLIDPPDDSDDINAETIYAPAKWATAVRDRLWWQDEAEIMVQLLGTVPRDSHD